MKGSVGFLRTLCAAIILIALCVQNASAYRLSADYAPGDRYQSVKLLGTLDLTSMSYQGHRLDGLSGLSWDDDEQRLYAISDRGVIFHLQPVFSHDQLESIQVLGAYPLKDRYGATLRSGWRDSEGLALLGSQNGIQGDTELIISFEGQPRVQRYTPQGKQTGKVRLPRKLRNRRNYVGPNKALEAITLHPEFGFIVAPEEPLKGTQPTLYATKGLTWPIPPSPVRNSAITGLETLPDGSLLLLERAYVSLLQPIVISLRQIQLSPTCRNHNQPCPARTLANFSSAQGWSIDNFEGLAYHNANRFFMVSDNNASWLQRTLLSYMEILPATVTSTRQQPPHITIGAKVIDNESE